MARRLSTFLYIHRDYIIFPLHFFFFFLLELGNPVTLELKSLEYIPLDERGRKMPLEKSASKVNNTEKGIF